MAIRYYIRYFDITDVEHRLNIYDDDYIGDEQQIDGHITLTYSETDEPLEAIRGQGLSVELEASTDLSFSDLWSEEQKTFFVEYKRDSVILFQGWLNPEGFFEDFVSTNWKVSFDCVDGLGFLTDLSFVEDATGFPITGRKTQLEILSLALIRTGLALKINTAIDIRYTGLSNTLDPLANVYVNTDRYVKDDGETIMSCEDVLRDILEPYGACITSFNGEWYIYKPNQLYNNQTVTFFTYTYLGAVHTTPTTTIDTSLLIGSQINNITPHHCSANQTIRNASSLGGYRINYKYGLAQSLIENRYLYTNDGSTYDDFSIASYFYLTVPPAGGYGAKIDYVDLLSSELVLTTNDVGVIGNVSVEYTFRYEAIPPTPLFDPITLGLKYQVSLTDGLNDYYLNSSDQWILNNNTVFLDAVADINGEQRIVKKVPPFPASGDFNIRFYTPTYDGLIDDTGYIIINEVSIVNLESNTQDLKGEFHTLQRTDKPASKVDDVKTVATGDSVSDIYEGTLYKTDTSTPTETWYRKGITESKPLLQIMGEEVLRMKQLPARVFYGDVFGYFPYLSVITIDGLSGLFMPIKYSYDTKENIITAEFRQIYGNELTDINYEKTYDYGNVVKPTIR